MNTDTRVRDVMSRPVVSAGADLTLGQVAVLLAEHRVGAVPVVDADGRPVGIVTEADLARGIAARGPEATAADVMSEPVLTVRAADRAETALHELRRLGVGRLPALDEAGRVVGIVSGSDLGQSRPPSRPPGDDEVRRLLLERVADLGGEVLAVSVRDGVVHIHVAVRAVGDARVLEHVLRRIPGVEKLELTSIAGDRIETGG